MYFRSGFGFFIFAIPAIFHFSLHKGEYPHLYTLGISIVLPEGGISGAENYYAAEVYKLYEEEFDREWFIFSASPIHLWKS